MPIIEIDSNHRLSSNFRSWELQKLRNRKHRETGEACQTWEAIRWYMSLENALHDVAQLRLRISEEEDIGLALAEVNGWLAGIRQALASVVHIETNAPSTTQEDRSNPRAASNIGQLT